MTLSLLQVGDAKLSEVKGPKDRLSDSQRAWLFALLDVDVRAEVLRVQVPGDGAVKGRGSAMPQANRSEGKDRVQVAGDGPRGDGEVRGVGDASQALVVSGPAVRAFTPPAARLPQQPLAPSTGFVCRFDSAAGAAEGAL